MSSLNKCCINPADQLIYWLLLLVMTAKSKSDLFSIVSCDGGLLLNVLSQELHHHTKLLSFTVKHIHKSTVSISLVWNQDAHKLQWQPKINEKKRRILTLSISLYLEDVILICSVKSWLPHLVKGYKFLFKHQAFFLTL